MCSSSVVWCLVWYGVVCVVVWHHLDFGAWCAVLCGLLYDMVCCCVAPHLPCVLLGLWCACVRVRACVRARDGVFIYLCACTERERGGVCEISCKWNLDVAENCHLKTPTTPKISFLIHSSISNSSKSSNSSTAL